MRKTIGLIVMFFAVFLTACGDSDVLASKSNSVEDKLTYEGVLDIGDQFIDNGHNRFVFAGIQNDTVVINHLRQESRRGEVVMSVQSYYIPIKMEKPFKMPNIDSKLFIESVNVEEGTISIELEK